MLFRPPYTNPRKSTQLNGQMVSKPVSGFRPVCGGLCQRLLRRVIARMGIGVQRRVGVAVAHQVLQAFEIHLRVGEIGAERMTQHMGRKSESA